MYRGFYKILGFASVLLALTALVALGVDMLVLQKQGAQHSMAKHESTLGAEQIMSVHSYYLSHGIIPEAGEVQEDDQGIIFEDYSQIDKELPRADFLSGGDLLPQAEEVEPEKATTSPQDISEDQQAEVTELAQLTPSAPVEKKTYDYTSPQGHGNVVIMIDDMGVSSHSRAVENLAGPLTLSFLPFGHDLQAQVNRARAQGHEIMLHMPMQAMKESGDGGPRVLKVNQSAAEFDATLNWGLNSFQGYVGVNNHMGSRLTQDNAAMQKIIEALKARGVYFVDSKTIGSSVAANVAAQNGLPYAVRDVFLDHEISKDFVRQQLSVLEGIAKRKGYAIAIGHPHPETIAVLKEWLPTLSQRGLTLVPASAVVKRVRGEGLLVSVPSPVINVSAQQATEESKPVASNDDVILEQKGLVIPNDEPVQRTTFSISMPRPKYNP